MATPSPLPAVLPTDDLASVVLVERTPGAHLLLAWSYPGLPSTAPAALRSVLLARTTFVEPTLSRFGKFCLYSVPVPAPSPSPSSSSPPPPLRALTLLSKSFAPERLLTLAQTLAQLYAASGAASPVPIQTAFLAALATSRVPRSIPNAPGPSSAVTRAAAASLAPDAVAWDAALFDPARTYRPAQGKATLTLVGVETVIVWTALMLRRRVAVYGPETAKVIRAARLLPLLVAHRFPAAAAGAGIALPAGYAVAAAGEEPAGAAALSSLIFPLVSLSDFPFTRGAGADGGDAENGGDGAPSSSPNALSFDGPLGASLRADIDAAAQAQAEDLAAAGTYVAGFTDPAVLARGGDLWDVLVDLGARTVTVAETSKADLALSSVHKEVAKALVASLEDPSSTDASPFAAVAAKSCALVDRLSAWFPGGIPPGAGAAVVSDFQALMKREGIPAGVERFLWGVANAEPRLRGKGSA